MTAYVRLFTHSKLLPAPVSNAGGRFSSDAVMQLKQPYIAKERLEANTGAAVASSAALSTEENGKLLFIQVQAGKTIHYEVIPDGHAAVSASATSPTLSGDTLLEFGRGWTISVLESSE